jgi:thymidylate synthase ThyX
MPDTPDASPSGRRVVVVAPMPPEKSAYALARYSRSPDSIVQSIDWVRGHSAEKFLESFYFQYGHASIADLGHCIFCFEDISELAAIEIEDEQLWDGQAKSSRYQDFSKGKVVTPPELAGTPGEALYLEAAQKLLTAYLEIHPRLVEYLTTLHPRPAEMKEGAYQRTIAARAYDVARYLLFLGISTNIGQVTSIRTLEKQMQRLGASRYGEVRGLAAEMHEACAAPPACPWRTDDEPEPLAPTLARYASPDLKSREARANVAEWAAQNLSLRSVDGVPDVDLVRPRDPLDEIAATLLYAVTAAPFRVLLDEVSGWSRERRREVLDVALKNRDRRDEMLREFRGGYGYIFDIVTDIGGYRDLHRHRRCQQIRQEFTDDLGYETPPLVEQAGVTSLYENALTGARLARKELAAASPEASHYLLPFAARCRSLYKMDFSEAEYIARVRSGVKGHISYRTVAWKMRERIIEAEPELGELIHATPPEVEDVLTR